MALPLNAFRASGIKEPKHGAIWMNEAQSHLSVGVTAISATDNGTLELVRRARDGDASAFECLYHEEVGRIYALCLRMTNDRARAGILTQDTFVRAWTRLDQFREDSTFSTWLYRIAVNVVLMAERTQKRRRARVTQRESGDLLDAIAPAPSQDASLDLEGALRQLPAQAKAVLILHEIEGYTHEEVGDMLGIAAGTSKAHLHRARNLLKQMLDV